jgi:hypothetical protein
VAVDHRGQPAWRQLDRRAVLRGAAAYLLIAVPCGLVAAGLDGHLSNAEATVWTLAVVLLVLVAPPVGGAVAATSGAPAPLTQSAVAVGVPTAVFLLARILDGIVKGTVDLALVTTLVLYLLILTGLAVLGGYLAFRRRSRPA